MSTKQALKEILETRLTNEIDKYIGFKSYERGDRSDYRNGSYVRNLLTELGNIVPRTRNGFKFKSLQSYQRRPEHVDRLIMSCFVLGMSTRKVSEALLPLLGEKISPQLVSNISSLLDHEVSRYHSRQLLDQYKFLYFDGVVLKHKGAAKVQKRVILCAFGVSHKDKHEMIDFMLSSSESQNAWEGFLRDLYSRGLIGENCLMIITDGGNGLRAALEVLFPRIPRQHCWAHKTRNITDKVKKADHDKVKKYLHAISHANNRKEATQAYWRFCEKYRKQYPQAVKSLDSHIEDLLIFYDIKINNSGKTVMNPEKLKQAQLMLWEKIRTTNLIERTFREVKRRTRPMGVLQNKNSMERILFAVLHCYNYKSLNIPLLKFTHNN